LRTRITDAVIDSAVRRLPPEYYAEDGPRLRTELTERRDGLTRAAADFYELMSSEVDVRASDEDEFAGITRAPDGSVTVTLVPAPGGNPTRASRPSFARRFLPGETREVRVFLRGGDDFARLSGAGRGGIKVRVIGGGGDDRMEDRSTGARGGALFYDDRGTNRLAAANGARIDTRPYEEKERESLAGNPPPPRDYGTTTSLLTPTARWEPNVGPVIGVGPSWTRFGFRRQPYARFAHARFVYAPFAAGIGAEVVADIRHTNRPTFTTIALRGNNFETTRFHGFGNSTTEQGEDRDLYIVRHDFLGGAVLLNTRLANGLTASVGPEVRFMDARVRSGSLIDLTRPGGTSAFTQVGAVARLHFDRRDTLVVTRRGITASAAARGLGWDAGAPFARLSGSAATYIPVGAVGPTVALRAGAERAIGDFPFQEAAYLGGSTTVRGYPTQRFAGDGVVFGSAELRQPVGEVKLGVRGRLGVLALADAGRVYFDGESGSDWHTAFGGGAYFETI
ncbi:MAG TPA: BamA/TamA family outer membrane protein, partial [Longimicrobium sp.]|nr:BamA/TamA family outer membrane protein [Longimicrobium sp.]